MDSKLTWKLILIVAVLLLFGATLYPPSRTLNLGLDLRGGTSLLYEVDVQGAEDPEQMVLRTIEVLQERVDPQGVRNLNWRVESGNRIEIQMPLAGEHVIDAREAYQDQLEQIEESSISRTEVQGALRLEGEARRAALDRLTQGVEGRLEALQEAAEAYDELQAARAALEGMEPGGDAFIEASGRVARAEIRFDEALDAVDATNLNPVELGRVLEMPTVPELDEQRQPIEGTSPRAIALEQLKESHPARAEQINRVVAAYDAYQEVKGPLDDPNDLIRLLQGAGVLEFRVGVVPGEAADVESLREQLREGGPRSIAVDAPMRWYVVDDPAEFADSPEALEAMRADAAAYFANRGLVGAEYGGEFYLLLWNIPGKSITQNQPGWELSQASVGADRLGRPAVDFQLNEAGGNLMREMTEANVERPMSIVLDDRVYSAPNINEPLGSRVQISSGSGGFSQMELDYLIRTLSAGSLKAKLSAEPISIRTIGPSLGQDNLQRGLQSAVYALIVVGVFMMIYYFFAGFVAGLALVANIVIILGVMAALQATFTLPGIAGVVLTIGMAVDANVLIFERIREEIERGADMPTSLRLGYDKAFSSIIDGNLTNLIIAFILGYTATADIKGFAVTLGIGIVATLFTSLFMTKAIFHLYYRAFGAGKMNMLPLAFPPSGALRPNIDWIGKRTIFYTISGVLIVGSIVMIAVRGEDMLDIEFLAGTQVTFDLQEGERITLEEARERVEGADLENYNVVTVGDIDDQGRADSFSLITTVTDPDVVAQSVREAFGGMLDVLPVIEFAGNDAEQLAQAPVYPITQANLGEVINRPTIENEVPDFLGGVAIVLDDISPPQTIETLEQSIRSMRFQPDFQDVQFRQFEVVGIEPAQQPGRFQSVAVVSVDPAINYFDNPDLWQSVLAQGEWQLVRDAMARETSLSKVSSFSPDVARSLASQAIVAMLLSAIAIIAYVWFRFGGLRYGLAGIAALVHDVIFTLGMLALSGLIYDNFFGQLLLLDPFKINMAVIAALLTIIGYSINDTIIIFDRIRENRGKLTIASPAVMNDSINSTISRTLITSGTTILATGMLYVMGGEGIHAFAFTMLVGLVIGTYSTVAFATPLLLIGTKYAGTPSQTATVKPSGEDHPVRV